MPTFECLKCHKTLTMDMQSIEQLQLCPFCLGKLREESSFDEIDTFGKAIYQVVKRGKDTGGNPKVIRGILMDVTPKTFETELNKFKKVFGGDQHFNTVLSTFDLETSAAEREFNKLATILIDEEGYNANWVEEIIGYCREAARYYHGENLPVKLNYIVKEQDAEKSLVETGKLSDDDIKAIAEEAEKFYASKDYEKAYKLYLKAAEQGNAEAQLSLGGMYELGYGVQKDDAKACAWYEKAAEQGDVLAQERSAVIYCNGGIGVPQDYTKAYEWFLKVAGQTDNIDCATFAQMYLAFFYLDGWGVPKDDAKAFEWMQKAAAQGYDEAQNNLGNMYYKGLGVPKDYAKANEWYHKAADQGNANALNNLGHMCQTGCGVPTDEVKACDYYRKAAEQGHADAQFLLGRMCEKGNGVPQDFAKAFEWYRKAAEQGHAKAQLWTGIYYETGAKGTVSKDLFEAYKWYQKAADQGIREAKEEIDRLKKENL